MPRKSFAKSVAKLSLFGLLTAWGMPAAAAPAAGPNRYFSAGDLFALEWATDPQISPDGRVIAYVRRSNDIMADKARASIWLVDVATGLQRPLIAGSGSYLSPRWSPDGARLAYLAADGGEPQLYVRWMATGQSAPITALPESPDGIIWSMDGRRIAFSMFVPDDEPSLGSEPSKPEGAKWAAPLQVIDAVTYRSDEEGYLKSGYDQIFWVSSDGGAPKQLTFGAVNAGGQVTWAADSRTIIFSADLSKDWERNAQRHHLYRISIDGGTPVALTSRNGPDEHPAVSPDGRYIAWTGYDDRGVGYQNTLLSIMNIDGSGEKNLSTSLDKSVENFIWAPDSRSVFIFYEDHGNNRIARLGLDGSFRPIPVDVAATEIDRPYEGDIGGAGQFTVARNGTLAVLVGNALRPANVAVVNGASVRQLTRLNESLLGSKSLAHVAPLDAVSSYDHRTLDAWMVTPPDFDPTKKYPAILEIHGGPFASYGPSFSTDDQLYASHGYIVVYANPRGSTGYGEEFGNLINKAYPGHDYDDLMSVVDEAIATGHVDPNNLFVTGGSGGGILTAWIVGKTDRFRAAAAQKPAVNWTSFVLTSDGALFYSPYWFAKRPWEDSSNYWQHSPLSLVGNVKTPTILVVGSEDYRTPDSEAEQFYEALQLRGVPTMLVKVPGASHGGIAARPSQSAAKASAILAWFDRYRDNGTSTVAIDKRMPSPGSLH
jgi:dipeptidyl aminopeptidase/acylaminoacyl peptidase